MEFCRQEITGYRALCWLLLVSCRFKTGPHMLRQQTRKFEARFSSCLSNENNNRETWMIDIFWNELNAGFPDSKQLVRIIIRLAGAMLMGAVIGLQREKAGKPAGLRTHILVALGSALLVIAATGNGMS